MASYKAISEKVRTRIKKYGREVMLRQLVRTPADADKPWRGATAPRGTSAKTLTTSAVFLDPQGGDGELGITDQRRSSLLARMDKIALISLGQTTKKELEDYDELVDDGETYRIQEIETLDPGSHILVHIVGLRR